jgi:pimeloyl-ACP methyl ester carboxylesterase
MSGGPPARSDEAGLSMNEPYPPPPSRWLYLMEVRSLVELGAFALTYPLLRRVPRGDGHPVLILPPLGTGDGSTAPLRMFLKGRGYAAHGWGLGRNIGPVPGMAARLRDHLARIREQYGRRVSLIGWSLGGIYARELAKMFPRDVRQVITLCSPFGVDPRASNAVRKYQRLSKQPIEDAHGGRDLAQPPPVPTTAIYSRSDGIVAWQGCVETPGPLRESVEIQGSHLGVGHHPLALCVIADRLAQPETAWSPFDRSGLRRFLYPAPGGGARWRTRVPEISGEPRGG